MSSRPAGASLPLSSIVAMPCTSDRQASVAAAACLGIIPATRLARTSKVPCTAPASAKPCRWPYISRNRAGCVRAKSTKAMPWANRAARASGRSSAAIRAPLKLSKP